MARESSILIEKLQEYKRKFYIDKIIRGSIIVLAILLSLYLLSTSLDFGFKPGVSGRSILFYTSLISILLVVAYFIGVPLSKLINEKSRISDELAAKQLGEMFPDLKDKLLNTIQLSRLNTSDNSLLAASLEKRTQELSVFRFASAIKFAKNKSYLKYALYPASILLILFLFVPQLLTESTVRIINYDKEFDPIRLFSFVPLENDELAFKNEDYKVSFRIDGSVIPDKIYLRSANRRIKLKSAENGIIEHTFKKIQSDFEYSLEASDYQSEKYQVEVYTRPDIRNFNINLRYPRYTNLENESLSNVGNVSVPEGTQMSWLVKTNSADSLYFSFSPEFVSLSAKEKDDQLYNFDSQVFDSQDYMISIVNEYSQNKDEIKHHIEVVKDKFPSISVNTHKDTTLYSFVYFGGNISDDYGISKLELVYSIKEESSKQKEKSINIPIGKNLKSQNYFYQWMLDSLDINQGDKMNYYLRVWDNDGINGSKFTRSTSYTFQLPDEDKIKEDLEKQAEGTNDQLDKSLEEAKELNDQLEDIKDKLKSKKTLDWQDKKQLDELIKQKEKLQQELEELRKKNESFSKKKERFTNPSEKLQEKVQQLQKLMEDLLDEETKKLYDELKKLLEEQKGVEEVQQMIDQIENKEENIEKEIERTLELFKKMQFDYKMEEIINELDKLEEEQTELSEKTEDKSNETEELGQKQDELTEGFEDLKEEMDKLEELNDNLKNPEDLENTEEDEENISEEQQNSKEELEKKQRKKASDSQKKAGEKMKKLSQKMKDMQSNMEMVMLEENIDNLEDIVDNLVKISFDQEKIMQEFRGVNQSDPRYVKLSQLQLKLRDDSKIIEDSLLSLAGRVFQIASFITRELDTMNDHIEASLQALKDRKLSQAVSNQQFSMSAINNLALLLDDILQQMQQQMSDAMGNPQKGKKGQKQKMPGLSELQQQLNKKIEDLKKGNKSGRQLSEELAKLAAQQEMIRRQLEEMEELIEQGGKEGGDQAKDAIKKMEQTEMDLVNKRISRQTIQRQKDILTRLLKAEDAMRERELDEEREAEQAEELQQNLPPQFEEYLKAKQKEVELLKTIPLKLNPYYKEEVNKYFNRLSEQ